MRTTFGWALAVLAVVLAAYSVRAIRNDLASQNAELKELRRAVAARPMVAAWPALPGGPPQAAVCPPPSSGGQPVAGRDPGSVETRAEAERPQQAEAVDQGHALVADSVRAGVFTARDRDELRRLAAEAGGRDDFGDVLRELAVALNRGELRLEDNRPIGL